MPVTDTTAAAGPGARRLLLADDEPAIRELLGMLLEMHGYTVTAVADGREALAAAAEISFDIALLDVAMPHMNGIVAAKHLKTLYPLMRIVFHTAFNEVHVREALPNLDGYLAKPVVFPALLAVLDQLAPR